MYTSAEAGYKMFFQVCKVTLLIKEKSPRTGIQLLSLNLISLKNYILQQRVLKTLVPTNRYM